MARIYNNIHEFVGRAEFHQKVEQNKSNITNFPNVIFKR